MYKIGSMPKSIPIGYTGETNFRIIEIDMNAWLEKMPAGVPSIVHVRPGESKTDAYVAVTEFDQESGILSWTITAADIGTLEGEGEMQVWLEETENDTISKRGKSVKVITKVIEAANDPDETVPSTQEAFLEQVTSLKTQTVTAKEAAEAAQEDAEDAAQQAQQAATDAENVNLHPAYIDSTTKHWMVYDATQHEYVDTEIIAEGQAADVIDDTAGEGDTDKTWSADKLDEELTDVKNAIQGKPDMKNTDAQSGVFDIADGNGYVVLRLKDGQIKTKEFDSEKSPAIKATDSNIGTFDLTDDNGNVILRLIDGHIQTKNFNSAVEPKPIEYKFSGSDLLLAYKYTATHDAVVVLNVGRANDLFDFSKFCLKDKGASLENLETADLTTVWNSGTDMHSPFQFNVTTDADGYYSSASDPSFTGGNHKVEINGSNVKSASSKYVYFFADGEPVTTGYGLCNHFTMKWANEVQAYNCVKADGTGRTSLIEYHEMIFDGVRFNEEIMLVPKEEITMKLWYGLQSVSWQVTYTKARFIDGTNRNEFTDTDNSITSGNAKTSGVIETGASHSMEMTVDICTDLGARPYYTGTSGAFIVSYGTSGKGYFNIINQSVTMDEGDGYFLRGSYRFYPTVA